LKNAGGFIAGNNITCRHLIPLFRQAYYFFFSEFIQRSGIPKASGKRFIGWSESIAVGDRTFVEDVMDRLGVKAMDREIAEDSGSAVLREPKIPYSVSFDPKLDL